MLRIEKLKAEQEQCQSGLHGMPASAPPRPLGSSLPMASPVFSEDQANTVNGLPRRIADRGVPASAALPSGSAASGPPQQSHHQLHHPAPPVPPASSGSAATARELHDQSMDRSRCEHGTTKPRRVQRTPSTASIQLWEAADFERAAMGVGAPASEIKRKAPVSSTVAKPKTEKGGGSSRAEEQEPPSHSSRTQEAERERTSAGRERDAPRRARETEEERRVHKERERRERDSKTRSDKEKERRHHREGRSRRNSLKSEGDRDREHDRDQKRSHRSKDKKDASSSGAARLRSKDRDRDAADREGKRHREKKEKDRKEQERQDRKREKRVAVVAPEEPRAAVGTEKPTSSAAVPSHSLWPATGTNSTGTTASSRAAAGSSLERNYYPSGVFSTQTPGVSAAAGIRHASPSYRSHGHGSLGHTGPSNPSLQSGGVSGAATTTRSSFVPGSTMPAMTLSSSSSARYLPSATVPGGTLGGMLSSRRSPFAIDRLVEANRIPIPSSYSGRSAMRPAAVTGGAGAAPRPLSQGAALRRTSLSPSPLTAPHNETFCYGPGSAPWRDPWREGQQSLAQRHTPRYSLGSSTTRSRVGFSDASVGGGGGNGFGAGGYERIAAGGGVPDLHAGSRGRPAGMGGSAGVPSFASLRHASRGASRERL